MIKFPTKKNDTVLLHFWNVFLEKEKIIYNCEMICEISPLKCVEIRNARASSGWKIRWKHYKATESETFIKKRLLMYSHFSFSEEQRRFLEKLWSWWFIKKKKKRINGCLHCWQQIKKKQSSEMWLDCTRDGSCWLAYRESPSNTDSAKNLL